MTIALMSASWLAVRRPPLLVPLGAAVGLVLVTLPWSGSAVLVVHGVGVLVACSLAATTDDPAAEVAAATPPVRRTRTAFRMVAGALVAVPVLLVGLVVAETRLAATPLVALGPEVVGYGLLALAVGAALRAWAGVPQPAYPAAIAVLVLVLATWMLPRGWTMVDPQPWGPPLQAALLRWLAVALLAVAVLTAALRDVRFPTVCRQAGAPHGLQPMGGTRFPASPGKPSP
jgi:hypothetical protein